MATLKHISSKNSDYTAIEAYLVYQHDAFTGKQLLDEQGKPKLRESYLLDTLECGDFSFATACLLANRKYGKNTQHGDIKSHQYIISFDPRDAADNGLTMEKAQALGLKFCEENFPGHPAIVCTHPDGHDHSGNIHVHIVIGSIRTREVECKPYMQKPRDWREGMKHSSTAQTMRHLRVEVMELCEGAGLYQIDLLNGSKERVSEAEYWARRRGQLKLDRENAALTATGQQPKQKKFETVKVACRGEAPPFAAQTARSLKSPTGAFVASQTRTLRKQISSVLYRATSFEDFSDKLIQQYGIAVKESRGQLSYLPAGRTKFIRAKKLGDKFDKAAVLATLQANAERKPKVQSKPTNLAKLIDIQAKLTEGKGIGYECWAKKFNLKAMSQTLILLQEKDLLNEDDLNQRIAELETKNTSPYPDEVIDRLARAFYPAILACWNSEEGQREFAAWQAEQVHHAASKEKQSVPDCWVSVKQFSKNDTATACQDWLRSTRLGRGSIKSHVRTVKVLGMGLFAFQERIHLWKGVTH